MNRIALLAGLCALAIPSTADAKLAVLFMKTTTASPGIMLLDLDTIRDTKPYRKAWMAFSLQDGKPSNRKSSFDLIQYDCENERYQTLTTKFYTLEGNPLEDDNSFNPWKYAAPHTSVWDGLNIVCGKSSADPKIVVDMSWTDMVKSFWRSLDKGALK